MTSPATTSTAEPQGLAVRFADDINPQLAEAFREEAPIHVSRLGAAVSRLTGDAPTVEDLREAQHAAHSLKGSSSLTGVAAIADLTHRLEDVLDWLDEHDALPPAPLRPTLQESADCAAAMVEALHDGGVAPGGTAALLQRLSDWRASVDAVDESARLATDDAGKVPHDAGPESGSAPAASVAEPAPVAPASAHERRAAPRAPASSLRVSVDLVDRLMRLAGEFAVSNVQTQGAHQRMTAHANALREQVHLVQQRLSDLQDLVEVRGVNSGQRQGVRTSGTGTVVEDFDPLELDEYNDLHSKTTALAEAMTDFCEVALEFRPELGRLDETLTDQQRISKELSDFVMSARMVPVGSIEERLQRTVRETCRATGKAARLAVTGGDIPVDGEVLTALADPLVHLLRNAVDHGLESAAERRASGKPETGALTVAFSREGDNVRVEVADDGRGFDVERIREVARSRGMLAGNEARTRRELMQLAVESGFSTRDEATRISGRGIGMDVVNRAAQALKGSLDIASERGAGATVSLRVPLTLISMHVLLVRVGSRVYGVPSSSLEQVLFPDAGRMSQETVGTVFTIEEREYEVCHLGDLTGRQRGEPATPAGAPMLLMQADSGLTAVVVDAAVDGRYLVVKTLGEHVPRPAGVIGASILGDGSVAPVLDLRELLRHRGSALLAGEQPAVAAEAPEAAPAREVLVVDDSLTARRMLSIALDDAGFRVRTAIDGLDAVEAVEECVPDLVVTDLEMPRMNGLELVAHLRAEARAAQLPILMVTSRSTDKHRGQAEAAGISGFITKPYSNEELLERVNALLAPEMA